jgi:hypothetical protein
MKKLQGPQQVRTSEYKALAARGSFVANRISKAVIPKLSLQSSKTENNNSTSKLFEFKQAPPSATTIK